jgi:lipopolysaccharide biosynthesis glycosyltransferase
MDRICIGAVSDDNYAPYLGVVLTSLLLNNPSEQFDVFIINAGISVENRTKFKDLSDRFGRIQIQWLTCDTQVFSTFKVDQHVSRAVYYRIVLPLLIPSSYSKCLYVDCDVLILGRIRQLWEVNIGNDVLAAVQAPSKDDRFEALGLASREQYFNTGIMLIDIANWRKEDISNKVLRYIQQNPSKIVYWDQDGLNAVLYDRWKPLNERWNKLAYTYYGYGGPVSKAMTFMDLFFGPCILHFGSISKPWLKGSQDDLRFFYWKYMSQSPWSNLIGEDKASLKTIGRWVFNRFPFEIAMKFKKMFLRFSKEIKLPYYRIAAKSILVSKPFTCSMDCEYEVRILTCKQDLILTIWCLKTFFYFSQISPAVFIHEDGSLLREDIQILEKHFPGATIISKEHADKFMNDCLKPYPASLDFRMKHKPYHSIRLLDFHFFSKTKNYIILDPDVLFFSKPHSILGCLKEGKGFFAPDSTNAYTVSTEKLTKLFSIRIIEEINAGILYFPHADCFNMELIEDYLTSMKGLSYPRIYWTDQTAFAILISTYAEKFIRLPAVYQISQKAVTKETISHHFVNDGSRQNFYFAGVPYLMKQEFINNFNKWVVESK